MPSGVYVRTEAHRRANSLAHLGKKHSPETIEKIRLKNLGKPSNRLSKTYEEIYGVEKATQMRKASSEDHLGEKNPNFGKHHSPATRKKQSLAKLGKRRPDISGPNCHLYRDGKSNEPYGVEFTSALRLKIRKRDDFMCQWPGCNKLENGRAHHVHHIDHNRHNNNELNLITLDSGCHSKEKLMALDEAIIMFEDILRIRSILK